MLPILLDHFNYDYLRAFEFTLPCYTLPLFFAYSVVVEHIGFGMKILFRKYLSSYSHQEPVLEILDIKGNSSPRWKE